MSSKVAFLRGVHSYLKQRLTPSEARQTVAHRMRRREEAFLKVAKRRIYGFPGSPYLPLLKEAGCSFTDLEELVRRDGLENALHRLRENGVYITFEEFKGREPVKRSGVKSYGVTANNFDNPALGPGYTISTSGSSGAGVRVTLSLDHVGSEALYDCIYADILDLSAAPKVLWFQSFPGFLGPRHLLRSARAGFPLVYLCDPKAVELTSPLRLAQQTLYRKAFFKILHWHGANYPKPEPYPIAEPALLARRLHALLTEHGQCFFRSYASMVLRVCLAANELGLDLSGVTFSGGGEPVTPAKVRTVKSTGAAFYPIYSCSDTGIIGNGCLNPEGSNDVHLHSDALALIQAKRRVPGPDVDVNAFYFTSLLPSAPKILLNVESDDYGLVDQRDCGCPLFQLGFTTHVRDIRSFSKLTGLGVSLVGSDAIRVLEESLPTRFGGSPLDYQLAEEEDAQGRTSVCLLVAPLIDLPSEQQVKDFFFQALESDNVANPFAAGQWKKGDIFKIKRQAPQWVGRGKLLPLHVRR